MNDIEALGANLRRVARGRVLVRGDEGFDESRLSWDPAVDQRVAAVVEARDAHDVAAVVGYAGLAGLRVATQATGHAPAAFHDAILLRTTALRGLTVRPGERVARAEAGVSWGEVLTAAGEHGLTPLAGSTGVVSATGFTLGGGLSWFGRKHGFAADGVRAFEVVDASGEQATVTADSDPELFWALRGGGGDFAVVTAMEFDLHPAPVLYGGRILWPAKRAAEVLAAFRATTAEAPEELTVWFHILQFPPLPELPEPLRGLSAVAIDATYLGDPDEARALLHRFDRIPEPVFDTRGRMPVANLADICAEPTDPTPSLLRSELLTGLDEATAAAMLAAAGSGTVAPLAYVQIRHLGGALARMDEKGGACGRIAEPYLLSMLGVPAAPGMEEAIRQRQSAVADAVAAVTTGRKPFTFLGHGEPAASAFPIETLARLREVKRRRDPQGVILGNHPVLG
ncbi:oxidoreductase [Microbispora rosea subsp. aerata]|nr:FAD-dependent oxidoreductase [Microbispora rosea]GGO07346.1 oxidoreductase [Microbispora rosea subsp. aerata]GIH53170.1 oxidoreductase [Microbispora rosea subsp. aerata]GLJ83918.1 oxidoreductase [Microbispora rosea subsp. aerata]